jgi:hypothetical protein
MTTFCCLRFETPQPGEPGPHIYIAQEQGGPVVPPGTAVPFRRLLRLAGLRWRWLSAKYLKLLLFYYYYVCSSLLGLGRFFSFLILYKVGPLGRGISSSQGCYIHSEQHEYRINAHNANIHALSGIRTQDPSVWVSEDSSSLRPRCHCDRRYLKW